MKILATFSKFINFNSTWNHSIAWCIQIMLFLFFFINLKQYTCHTSRATRKFVSQKKKPQISLLYIADRLIVLRFFSLYFFFIQLANLFIKIKKVNYQLYASLDGHIKWKKKLLLSHRLIWRRLENLLKRSL